MTLHALRLPVTLLLSLALWMPVLDDMMVSSADVAAGVLRYLAALGVSWIGVALLLRLVQHFATVNARLVADEVVATTIDRGRVVEDLAAVAEDFEEVLSGSERS